MNADLFAAVMELPENDRFEFAMTILDESSPAAMTEDEIIAEAEGRLDELEDGTAKTLSYDELVASLSFRPRSLAK